MNPAARHYAQVQAGTASTEQLMVLLFEATLRHLRAGQAALASGDQQAAGAAIDKACDIVVELQRSLKHERAPELCDKLAEIYGFVVGRLALAGAHRDPRFLGEAERAFAPIVDAFRQAVPAAKQVAR